MSDICTATHMRSYSSFSENQKERLTWDEIRQKYPNQLLGLSEVKWVPNDHSKVESAVVLYTDKSMQELVEIQIETKGKVVMRDTE